jgi:hypothetical protein
VPDSRRSYREYTGAADGVIRRAVNELPGYTLLWRKFFNAGRALRPDTGTRRRRAVNHRRAHLYSTERMDRPTTRRRMPGRTGRNSPAEPNTSRDQPDAIMPTRFMLIIGCKRAEF